MTAQHTPGPWRTNGNSRETGWPTVLSQDGMVADCGRDSSGSISNLTQFANARLIAAAPELLAALDLVLARLEVAADDAEELGYDQRAENIREDITTARAAIAKAGGDK